MFLGTYKSQVGKSNRIVVPKELREPLIDRAGGGNIVYLRRRENFLEIYPSWEWEKLAKDIEDKSLLSEDHKDLMLEIGKTTYPLKFNSTNGRVTIPSVLLDEVGIKKNILFEGAIRYFTIKAAND